MKVLVVEDDPRMARLLGRGLREEAHVVDQCEDGRAALAQASTIDYDVVVLDWNLPELDGVSVVRALRERGVHAPVLLLTARGSVGERVTGLRAGADDYLVKPFDFEELLARIDALGRRGRGQASSRALGRVRLDRHRRALTCESREVGLTAREYALLDEMMGRSGEALTRTELLASVWGPSFDGEPNVVDVYVGYLRAKLREVAGEAVKIQAVRGVGYRLVSAEGDE